MRKDRYHIFLSSCYDKDMRVNRELFRSELLARFNIISGALGINTYLIDLSLVFHMEPAKVRLSGFAHPK